LEQDRRITTQGFGSRFTASFRDAYRSRRVIC
jgi:hypothetical protein